MKHVLIMDEVDGMAGNEDRGGMQVRSLFLRTAFPCKEYWLLMLTSSQSY